MPRLLRRPPRQTLHPPRHPAPHRSMLRRRCRPRLLGRQTPAPSRPRHMAVCCRCPCVLPRCPPCLLLLGPAPPSRPRKLAASARQLFQKTPPRLLRYTHHPPRKPRRLEHGTRPDHRCHACHAAHRPSPSRRYGSLKTAGFNEVKTRCPVFRLPMQATPKAA